METISNYLDNMFGMLSQTKELQKLKENLYNSMEDKYNELKASGKSENEAIGIVISEFGNIDELIKELGISRSTAQEEMLPTISGVDADKIIADKQKHGRIIGIGVLLCIMAPAALILLYEIPGTSDTFLGLITMFSMIAVAVCLFISSGLYLEKYKYLEKPFNLAYGLELTIRKRMEEFRGSFTIHIIVGVMLCILSPLSLIIISSIDDFEDIFGSLGVCMLLIMIAIAAYLFIDAGTKMDTYKELLQEDDYSKKAKTNNKIVSAVAAIVWPLTVVGFLLWSFIGNAWYVSWIVFPIVGICFGAFSAACNILTSDK